MVLLGNEEGRHARDKGAGKKLKNDRGRIFHPPTCE